MALVSGLNSALSGMHVAQSQISIVSGNLANVDTEGYTRKTAAQQSNVLAGFGAGVKLKPAGRTVDQSLLRSYLMANSQNGHLNKSHDYLSKTENLLGSPADNNSIAANVADLQSSFETLATDVTSSTNRYALVADAINLTERMNSISTEIQSLRGDADMEIQEICNQINSQIDSIANLNNQIVKYTALGYDGAADLEDQRDEALKKLSGYIDISYYARENGEVVIQTRGGVALLDKDPHHLSHGAVARAATDISYANGNINPIMVDDQDITTSIQNGELKGLIDVRDSILPSLQTQLDELAGVMRDTINAIHNQGTSFPGTMTAINGSRGFITPDTQTVKIEKGDVRLSIFDTEGNQIATAALVGDLGFPDNGESVTAMINRIDTWIKQTLPLGSATIDPFNGRVSIQTGDSNYYFSMMDTATSTIGSEQTPAVITMDNNEDGVADRTFSGFSAFLGMNDFFVTEANEYIYESNVMGKNVALGVTSPVTLNIKTPTLNADLTVVQGDSLQTIVDKINQDQVLNKQLKASLIPNGNGYMLQLTNASGEQMEISEVAQNGEITGFLSRIGLGVSYCNAASKIQVREDIHVNPSLMTVGSPEFNITTGKYQLNEGNNSIANQMARAFAKEQTFGQAGSLAKVTTTLADYASTFVGGIASQTSSAAKDYEYQNGLVSSLANKQAQMSGVDSDEELANLIVYQQSYAACAQVWSASRELIDILFNAL